MDDCILEGEEMLGGGGRAAKDRVRSKSTLWAFLVEQTTLSSALSPVYGKVPGQCLPPEWAEYWVSCEILRCMHAVIHELISLRNECGSFLFRR